MSTVVTSENSADFYAAKMGVPSAPAPTDPVEQTKPVDESNHSEETHNDADETANEQGEQKPVNPKVEKRFGELTKQREEARREAAKEREAREAAEAKARELEAKLNPPKEAPVAEGKPRPDQFTDAFEYAEALAEWSAENAIKTRERQEEERKQQAEREKVIKSWAERQDSVKVEIPDYEDTIKNSTVSVSNEVREAILDSEIGPKILYHLAKNPDIAESLASKSTISALREIGRLEASLSADKPVTAKPAEKPSKAPPPINPIRATKPVDTPIDSDGEFTGTFAEWKAGRAAGKIK